MRILVAGGSGFIGTALVQRLSLSHSVTLLSRGPSRSGSGPAVVSWSDPRWRDEVGAADVVVNLAGENIGSGRWTAAKKERLVSSRVSTTERIVEVLAATPARSRTLINASAVGFYGSRGDEVLTEASAGGDDFLARLCRNWERAASAATGTARVVIFRFGVVLGPGGSLEKMALPFRLFAGGPMGSGRQWISWIDRDDLEGLIEWAIGDQTATGTYNATSPNPVTNADLARELGRVLRRPSLLPAPRVALRLVLGEMADALLLASQRALPERVVKAGYTFQRPSVGASLEAALEKRPGPRRD
jgi:uncharacterized protein (TIGR01777 family)